MNRFLSLFLTALAVLCVSCEKEKSEDEKNISLWICCDANFERLSSKDSVCFYLDKALETGFNEIVVDVKGSEGYALYNSSFVPVKKSEGNFHFERDWDYLEYFIEQAHKRGIKVMVSATPFAVGTPCLQTGPVYENPKLKSMTCVEYTPEGFKKIEDDLSEVSAFLNPVLPESQDYALNTLREIFSNYSFDAFCLDYCRYPNIKSDFSEASKTAFEKYLGTEIENFPADVFIYDEKGTVVPGRYYKDWWTFRSLTIRNFIERVRDLRDELQPDVELGYWAASWLHALYPSGQNWASSSSYYYKDYDVYTEDYNKTGFAELLDVFISGTYLERIWGMDDLESIEYGLWRSKRDCAGACRVEGSLYAVNTLDEFDDACYLCLRDTEGLMVFDLVHVINNNLWDKIKAGIERYKNEK